ncbi:rhamnulokinase [Vallitalea guaymasensis]|uniref:rhamnulokinase n=1 Tax=Vallitalea guaymasensis TaxID=1185412 RepID=UPI000DE4B306|nr:rhamnulokinase family protein [Vallitalea guaymasensis]
MKMLAFDFGASSGRGIIGELKDNKIILKEVHRFENEPVKLRNHLQWDFLRLVYEIKKCLIKCKNDGEDIKSIGIDTWGVDYGLIDGDGELITSPFHYRDSRTDNMTNKCFEFISKEELIRLSGIDCNQYNTIYQLLAETETASSRLEDAQTMLLMPDLFNYILTGVKKAEYTIATTTQLYNYHKNDWNYDLIDRVGLPSRIFPEIIQPGHEIGNITDDIKEELDIDDCKVISVGSHDTSSAIAAIPAIEEDFIFIATGTWVMVGVENEGILVNETTQNYGLSNEGGVGGKVNLLKNIMGLWLIQESKRQWNKDGIDIGFGEMVEEGLKAKTTSIINPDHKLFYAPSDMPNKIKRFCEESGQPVPETIGEIVRVIEESLALTIKYTIEGIEKTTNKRYNTIHMFGGGIQDKLLCQLVANATGKEVITGPKEATSMGNILLQAIGLGEIENIKQGREIVRNSIEIARYVPEDNTDLDDKYNKYLEIIK